MSSSLGAARGVEALSGGRERLATTSLGECFPSAWHGARPPFTAAFSFALIHCVSFRAPCEEQRESLFQQTGPIRSARLCWSRGWKGGMEGEGGISHPCGAPRAACVLLPSKYGKRSA